jgi:hypothetical protein
VLLRQLPFHLPEDLCLVVVVVVVVDAEEEEEEEEENHWLVHEIHVGGVR